MSEVEQERQARQKQCQADVEVVLKQHGCAMVVGQQALDGQVVLLKLPLVIVFIANAESEGGNGSG